MRLSLHRTQPANPAGRHKQHRAVPTRQIARTLRTTSCAATATEPVRVSAALVKQNTSRLDGRGRGDKMKTVRESPVNRPRPREIIAGVDCFIFGSPSKGSDGIAAVVAVSSAPPLLTGALLHPKE